jgi:hypothetical protein
MINFHKYLHLATKAIYQIYRRILPYKFKLEILTDLVY